MGLSVMAAPSAESFALSGTSPVLARLVDGRLYHFPVPFPGLAQNHAGDRRLINSVACLTLSFVLFLGHGEYLVLTCCRWRFDWHSCCWGQFAWSLGGARLPLLHGLSAAVC
jgi:hypothetical protein